MRLPLRKIYRAFPELDGFSDEECERYLRQVRVGHAGGLRHAFAGVVIVIAGVVVVLPGIIRSFLQVVGPLAPRPAWDPPTMAGVMVASIIATAAVGMGGGLLVRDWSLRRALRDRLDHARCTNCRQSLLGLPILRSERVGGGHDDQIRCPECGTLLFLADLGLRPEDLMPRPARTEDRPDAG